jgi:hypothetical protein
MLASIDSGREFLMPFVTSVVCIATSLSPITVTLLIAYLQGYSGL